MKGFAWILALVAVVAVCWWWTPIKPKAVVPPSSPVVVAPSPSKAVVTPQVVVLSPLRPNVAGQALADQLNAPDGDPAQDVITLHRILQQYQRVLHGQRSTPIGDDIDLARALKGRNPMKQVFIPSTHPALSIDGHILDRWGTPYHLHPRGNGAFEVRSAGPDRKLYTEDDLVANAPKQGP